MSLTNTFQNVTGSSTYHQNVRALQRSIHCSLKNHIFSILYDIEQMDHNLQNLKPILEEEFFLNLRTGAWYDLIHKWKSKLHDIWMNDQHIMHGVRNVEGNDDESSTNGLEMHFRPNYCYFQSKNGHCETMSFASLRFNPQILFSALKHGRGFIVDATRRGKIFPDSLLKTIPIWITVINQQVLCWHNDVVSTLSKYVSPLEYERAMQVVNKYKLPAEVIQKMQIKVLEILLQLDIQYNAPFLDVLEESVDEENESTFNTSDEQQVELPTRYELIRTFKKLKAKYLNRNRSYDNDQDTDNQETNVQDAVSLIMKPIFINPLTPYNSWQSKPDFIPLFLISASESERESKLQGTYTYLPGAGDDMEAWIPDKNFSAAIFWKNFTNIHPNEDMTEDELKDSCLNALRYDKNIPVEPHYIHNKNIFIGEGMRDHYKNEYDIIIQLGSPKALKNEEKFSNVFQFQVCNHKKYKLSLVKNFKQILHVHTSKVSNESKDQAALLGKSHEENSQEFAGLDENPSQRKQSILVLSVDPVMTGIDTAFAVAVLLNFYLFEAPQFAQPRSGDSRDGTESELKALTMMCNIDFPQCFLSRLLYKQMKRVIRDNENKN